MLEFMQVYPYFDTNDFHAKVIDDFLFIEAEVKHGMKGVNYTTYKFKTCRKLFVKIDVSKLQVIYREGFLYITTEDESVIGGSQILIDKRQAKKNNITKQKFVSGDNSNYERFISGLKAIGMM